jgi:4-hydroxy-2-oxoheptanedioate aldolase
MKLLRDVLAETPVALGGWSMLDNSFAAEVLGQSGFDWICVDMQHGHITSAETLVPMLQVLNRTDTPALVRIPWKTDFGAAMRALDSGAQGIVVPMLETAEEARAIAAACRYQPDGFRSWGPIRAATEIPGYTPERADALVVCLAMIETRAAMGSLDEILAVPGIDGAYIGPADLSLAHRGGLTFTAENPVLAELARTVCAACVRHGKIPGIHSQGPADAIRWAGEGFRFITVTSDSGLIQSGARDAVLTVRSGLPYQGEVRAAARR